MSESIHLPYGRGVITAQIPSRNVTVLAPRCVPGLGDEARAFRSAVRNPIESRPLKDLVKAGERVAIVIPDITRPLPSERLLQWVLETLGHVSRAHVTIIGGSGSHRTNSAEELASMVGRETLSACRVVSHSAYDRDGLAPAGKTPDGRTVLMNRHYVEADRRIVLGFIEPHFMAGFSGGYKGVFPALADIDSILHYHRASVIGDPRSTWGNLEDNPTQTQIRTNGSLLPVDFCINVTLNRRREITGFFCGEVLAAHRCGCDFARETAMTGCRQTFPVVVTSNNGYPLDQNLYQAVKGISAAAQIVEEGGLILCAARCSDGFPDHGNFRRLLCENPSPAAMLERIRAPGFSICDQWQVQLLALILIKARVALRSEIPAEELRRAHLEPVADIGERIRAEIARTGPDAPVAVLPEGPMTIPFLTV